MSTKDAIRAREKARKPAPEPPKKARGKPGLGQVTTDDLPAASPDVAGVTKP